MYSSSSQNKYITMKASEFTPLGTNQKRPARPGSRPDRGHEPQQRYVTDRKTGKQYDPDEEFAKLQNSPEFQAQMKRMAQTEDVAEDSGGYYSEEVAQKIYDADPSLRSEDDVLNHAYSIVKAELGTKTARYKFNYDEDFPSDIISNYIHLQKQGIAESFDYTMKDFGNDYSGFPSNHGLKHKMLKRIKPEKHQLYKDKMNNMHEFDQLLKLFKVAQARGDIISEGASKAIGSTAKRLTDPTDGKTAKLRAAGDKRREEQLKGRDIAKREVTEVSDKTKASYKAKATAQVKELKPHAEKGEYKDIAQRAIDRREKGLKRVEENFVEHFCEDCGGSLAEHGKASRALCLSRKPDEDLGASNLSSCKSQGLRARDGNKSHKLGKTAKSRVKVGGHKIKGNKYGGPLPDWS